MFYLEKKNLPVLMGWNQSTNKDWSDYGYAYLDSLHLGQTNQTPIFLQDVLLITLHGPDLEDVDFNLLDLEVFVGNDPIVVYSLSNIFLDYIVPLMEPASNTVISICNPGKKRWKIPNLYFPIPIFYPLGDSHHYIEWQENSFGVIEYFDYESARVDADSWQCIYPNICVSI